MRLDPIRNTFEKLGNEDPLYGVLTLKRYRHNRGDPEEFFATGVRQIDGVIAHLASMDRAVGGRALDFGCGVGRLTQALAVHFDAVVGVDISSTMLEKAREFNRHGDRVLYEHNVREDLGLFPDASFDLVYSDITLQHVPPASSRRYIREFFRVLRPGGLAVFQVPGGPAIHPGTVREMLYLFRRRPMRRLWKRLRGRPAYEMHYVAREQVEQIIQSSGGSLLDVVHLGGRARYPSYRYYSERLG